MGSRSVTKLRDNTEYFGASAQNLPAEPRRDGQLDKIGFKQEAYTTYDGKAKQWRRVVVDSLGGQMTGTSTATSETKLDFALDTISPMGPMMLKEHVDMTDPKAPKIATERSMDHGKTWQNDYALTCAKG
jgi:hypothetical protein